MTNTLTGSFALVDPNNMTFEEFRGVMSYEFQGIDPLCDKYYWNLWQDSRRYGCKNTAAKPDWEDFLTAIRTGKI